MGSLEEGEWGGGDLELLNKLVHEPLVVGVQVEVLVAGILHVNSCDGSADARDVFKRRLPWAGDVIHGREHCERDSTDVF